MLFHRFISGLLAFARDLENEVLTWFFMPMQDKFGVKSIRNSEHEMMAALYLQVSVISQALIFVTRSRSWSYVERPGLLLMVAFIIAQLVRVSALCIILLLEWIFLHVNLDYISLVLKLVPFYYRLLLLLLFMPTGVSQELKAVAGDGLVLFGYTL